jgi:hypothetical protein
MSSFTTPLASFSSDTFTPDSLVLTPCDYLVSRKITLASGQANLARGSLLGKITLGAATSAVKASGANTGTGTLVLDVTTPIIANAKAGLYTVRCITAGANAATFRVVDPSGAMLGDVSFTGAGASGTFADRIKFVVTDAGTDFVVGDGFDVTIAAGAQDAGGNYKFALATAVAVDGSAVPDAILVEATDATSADTLTLGYFRGRFAQSALTLGAGITITNDLIDGLRVKGIDLISILSA